jgi:hypothetical protein
MVLQDLRKVPAGGRVFVCKSRAVAKSARFDYQLSGGTPQTHSTQLQSSLSPASIIPLSSRIPRCPGSSAEIPHVSDLDIWTPSDPSGPPSGCFPS